MMVEIEAKVKVESLDEIRSQLGGLAAEFQNEFTQVDIFFDDSQKKLSKSGCGLRLRRQTEGNREKVFVTFKGPKQKGAYKVRQEIEFELSVSAIDNMAGLFEALGYEKMLVYEKRRTLWLLDGCDVCLDEVPLLGRFVEVEGPDEGAIALVLKKLRLADRPHINKGYAGLMREKLDELSSGKTEIFFDN